MFVISDRRLNSGCHKKTWLHDYNTADRVKTTLMSELEYTSEQISQMNGIIDKLRSPSKEEEIRQKLSTVVTSLNQFGSFFRMDPISLTSEVPVALTGRAAANVPNLLAMSNM